MKYWNKDKNVRQRCWTKVTLCSHAKLVQLPGGWVHTRMSKPTDEIKRWCQQQDSTGKFYTYFGSDSWWFEHEQDAIMFKLRWE